MWKLLKCLKGIACGWLWESILESYVQDAVRLGPSGIFRYVKCCETELKSGYIKSLQISLSRMPGIQMGHWSLLFFCPVVVR